MSDVLSLAKQYILLGVIISAAVCLLYVIFARRKKPSAKKLLLCAVLACYLTVVAGAVWLSRGNSFRGTVNLRPLTLFRDAWYSFTAVVWRNLILNVAMFIPLGILLPLLSDRFKRLWSTVGTGFLISVLIEIGQYVTARGQASTDDVMTNTAGVLTGYGLLTALLLLNSGAVKRKALKILGCLSPLLAVTLVFAAIFVVYDAREFGNMTAEYYNKKDMDDVSVSCQAALSGETSTAYVYKGGTGEPVAQRAIISQTEAFGRLAEGRFHYDGYFGKIESIDVLSVRLRHHPDTKDFYRPVYVFDSLINGHKYAIDISALD